MGVTGNSTQLAMDRLAGYRAPRNKLRSLCLSGDLVRVRKGLYVAKHQVHPNQVSGWNRQAQTGLEELFAASAKRSPTEQEALIHDLHAKIGELTVERDFSARARSLSPGATTADG